MFIAILLAIRSLHCSVLFKQKHLETITDHNNNQAHCADRRNGGGKQEQTSSTILVAHKNKPHLRKTDKLDFPKFTKSSIGKILLKW